jgi:hypothetical protein
VRRSDPFINDAAEFHGSGRRCDVEIAVTCRFVGSWLSYSLTTAVIQHTVLKRG